MFIQKINNTDNNYRLTSRNQNSSHLSFGKLIIDDGHYMPEEVLEAITVNKELKKLTQLFHNLGYDIEMRFNSTFSAESVFMWIFEKGSFPTCHTVDVIEDYRNVAKKIRSLGTGYAKQTFKNFFAAKSKQFSDIDMEKLLSDVDSFNNSQTSPKKSLWKRFFGKK